eukprot:2217740-Pleurochrysis_carterae.AAC.1
MRGSAGYAGAHTCCACLKCACAHAYCVRIYEASGRRDGARARMRCAHAGTHARACCVHKRDAPGRRVYGSARMPREPAARAGACSWRAHGRC